MSNHVDSKLFYQGDSISVVRTDLNHRRIFQSAAFALAEFQVEPYATYLLGEDVSGSICRVVGDTKTETHTYTAYGFNQELPSEQTLLGYNREPAIFHTGSYLLGSYRAYSSALMRFGSPDDASPFRRGGINGYCYVVGDPINYTDPTGKFRFPHFLRSASKGYKNFFGRKEFKQNTIQNYSTDVENANRKNREIAQLNSPFRRNGRISRRTVGHNQYVLSSNPITDAPPALTLSDRKYAHKHNLRVETFNTADYKAAKEVQAQTNKAYNMLELAPQQQLMQIREITPQGPSKTGNPIDRRKGPFGWGNSPKFDDLRD